MTVKLALLAAMISSGSLLSEVTPPASPDKFSSVTNLIIAVTGLIAAFSALILGLRNKRERDPRDKLIEILLKEREEAGREDAPSPPKRRRKRSTKED